MSAAARNAEPRQPRRRRAAPSSTTAQTTSPAADPITRSGDPASRFPSQANTLPFLPEVWAQLGVAMQSLDGVQEAIELPFFKINVHHYWKDGI